MIKSTEQCISIQTRRHEAGKAGLAKAIDRYLKRNHPEDRAELKTAILRESYIEPEKEDVDC